MDIPEEYGQGDDEIFTLDRNTGAYDPDMQLTMELFMELMEDATTEYGQSNALDKETHEIILNKVGESEYTTYEDGDTVYVIAFNIHPISEEEFEFTTIGIGHVDNVIFSEAEEESES